MALSLIAQVDTISEGLLMAFHILSATSIVSANSLLLIAFCNSKPILRRNNFLYALSITVCDLIVGAGWFYNGLHDINDSIGLYYSPAKIFPTIHGVSLVTLMCATLDRYYAVQSPFKYKLVMTRTKVLLIIGVTWAFPIITLVVEGALLGESGDVYHGFSTLFFSMFMLFVMIFLNLRLYIVTRRQQSRETNSEHAYKNRSAWLIIITSTSFLIFWAPSLFYIIICFTVKACFHVENNAKNPLVFIRMLNTLSTPIIFLLGSPLTRSSLKDLAQRLRCKRSHVEPVGNRN
ncbi:trace amine-associated receptor 6-like [Callorhinchus milii]|uniref:trace amine-associated receptor 6-like n=1 Tax=Callorhinchus milii TaxID=7868 RepID=UPI001C3FEDBE|nr:trace amine-associated receptor 6-like [Callorhinchus milii]